MPSTEGVIVKKVLPLIYVIDTSGSMFGDRIASVNEAIHELEPILREKVGEIPEAEIKIAALTFSSGAQWITANGLVSLDDFFWNDATAGGLTDLGAAIAGGMGLAAGANLNPEKKYPSMFEPIHGSAPDIAGKGIANPLAAIWSASQLLDFLGYEAWGKKIIDGIETMLSEKNSLTPDQGGSAGTAECGDAMVSLLRA